MKLKELKEVVDYLIEQNNGEKEVVIDLDQIAFETSAYSDIKTICYNDSQIRIQPTKNLISRGVE